MKPHLLEDSSGFYVNYKIDINIHKNCNELKLLSYNNINRETTIRLWRLRKEDGMKMCLFDEDSQHSRGISCQYRPNGHSSCSYRGSSNVEKNNYKYVKIQGIKTNIKSLWLSLHQPMTTFCLLKWFFNVWLQDPFLLRMMSMLHVKAMGGILHSLHTIGQLKIHARILWTTFYWIIKYYK